MILEITTLRNTLMVNKTKEIFLNKSKENVNRNTCSKMNKFTKFKRITRKRMVELSKLHARSQMHSLKEKKNLTQKNTEDMKGKREVRETNWKPQFDNHILYVLICILFFMLKCILEQFYFILLAFFSLFTLCYDSLSHRSSFFFLHNIQMYKLFLFYLLLKAYSVKFECRVCVRFHIALSSR